MHGFTIARFDGSDDRSEDRLQIAQVTRDRLSVRHADIRPHIGVRRCDACRILEAATCELQARFHVAFALVEERHKCRCRHMRHMADD